MTSERVKKPKPYRTKRFGILNPYGDLWTPETFNTAEGAERHIDRYLARNSHAVKFTVVPVRVTVSALKQRVHA